MKLRLAIPLFALVVGWLPGCQMFRDADSIPLQTRECPSGDTEGCECIDDPRPSQCRGDASDLSRLDSGADASDTSEAPRVQIVNCTNHAPAETITLQNRSFVQGDRTVSPGAVVMFDHRDDEEHTVESGTSRDDPDRGALFETETLQNGASVCLRFETTGEYPYLCGFHPDDMQGRITVRKPPSSSNRPREVDCSTVNPAETIPIENRTFRGGRVDIAAGEIVAWRNRDDEEHTIVSGENEEASDSGDLFDSGPVPSGDAYCLEFPDGVFPYFCRIRGADEMSGTVAAD